MKISNKWFTLIEILVWVLIFSIVIVWGFYALSAVNLWKIKLMQNVNITKDAYYFSEKFFEEIKSGWTIDFEEYFNRKVVNEWNLDIYSSWHYTYPTWIWNFWYDWTFSPVTYWEWFYYCLSWDWVEMWTWWCYSNLFNTISTNTTWRPQRYWQYSFQFIDYNSNKNDDLWDEDGDWDIRWDDDDEDLWVWPEVFSNGTDVKEIYLISGDWKKRTFLRWNVKQDPDSRMWATCDFSNPEMPTWSGCLWTIEFLKFDWKDWWMDHDVMTTSTWSFDSIIDTWLIDNDFTWWWNIIAWENIEDYWKSLFPTTINVKDFEVYMYPNIDIKNSWNNISTSSNINPYLRISYSLKPSWKVMSVTKWDIPEIKISTTINLSDYFNY